ncbi:oligosaccharide flippase family protein [uncultured Oscillibacter sp.]|uniref:oligosaccharide flippase family protein n=1 Tax=uncultured Oscillibacter sp. TaxID=876091 RepID=UPI0025F632BD|nr:oligosaccharide flippase family protein [uncultured Oscillibacter sp.]
MFLKRLLRADGDTVSRTEKTLALTIANTVNTALNVLSGMIASRLLTKIEVAVNSQTFLAYNTILPLLVLGTTSGIYYHLAQNEDRKRGAVKEAVLVTLATSAAACVFLLLGGRQLLAERFHNVALSQTLLLLIPYALLTVPASVMSCVFVAENRLRFNAVYSTFQVSLQMIVAFAAMLLFRSGGALVAAKSLTGSLFAIVTIILAFSILPQGGDRADRPQWSSTKALLAVSIPLGISAVVGALDLHLDQWIISTMMTPEEFAVYTRGAQELPFVGAITGSISTVIIVDLTKAAQKGEYTTAVDLFRKVSEKSSLFLLPAMVFFMAAARPLITLLYTEAYLEAVPVFQIYLLYMPIRVAQYSPFLIALGCSKLILWKASAELALNAVLSIFMVSHLGSIGAALATIFLVYVFDVPLNFYFISKKTGASWKRLLAFKKMFLCIVCSIPGAVAFWIFNALLPLPPVVALTLDLAIFCSITCPIFIRVFRLSPQAFFQRIGEVWDHIHPN